INGFGASGPYSSVVVIPLNYSDTSSGSFSLTASYTTTSSGNVSCVDIKPDTTSLVTGDNGINGKQQYYLIIMDDSNRQVLQDGTTWGDNSPYINIDENGLATVTNTAACVTITASLLTYTSNANLSAASHGTIPAGTPMVCTETNDMVCAVTNSTTKSDSRCFIATAAFGSPLHPYVELLREFRDVYLLTNPMGRWFVTIYYNNSPPIAEIIKDNSGLKAIVKIFLIPAIIVSWAILKTTLSEKIIIAVLLAIIISIKRTLLKTYVP
ncbi:MAG: CFI-box-CTERM domain-containing protein, partial [Nitrospirota bacterium]